MQGIVAIDIERLSHLLKPHIAENISKLKIASTCILTGNFWMNPDFGATFLDTLSFKGRLVSEKPILKGYQLKYLQSDLQYIPGRLDFQNAIIEDPAGVFKCPQCVVSFNEQKDKWTFMTPDFTFRNLNLSLLKDVEADLSIKSKFRSLVLKKVTCHNFQGDLDDLQTWQGEGSVSFLNSPRKNLFTPLFAIPSEIILRVGLDPHVLNPVTGTIDFEVRDNRFYLTKFKDVYSEGHGSKFYLAHSSEVSWMDFDGNLSVSIRMKQYNLIFKIAELFTFSIQGNIQKPRYTLQKLSKKGKFSE